MSSVYLKTNIWKRHKLKLENIRKCSNTPLEFPTNVLQFDRTEGNHIAQITAFNGMQHVLSKYNK